jgi:ribonuclease HI
MICGSWDINSVSRQQGKKPVPRCFKINTDAAFSDDSKQGAISCVIRDHEGAFQAARSIWYDRCFDACYMEAACRDGLKLALQRGFQRVVVETDCLQVVQLWNKVETQRSIIDPILCEISDIRFAF